jgi:HSP20 family protein
MRRRGYPVNLLRGELNRAFDDVFGEFFGRGGDGAVVRGQSFPAVNVWEDEEKLYAEAEVPGLKLEDLDIMVQGNELTLRGERKGRAHEGVVYHRRERGTGSLCSVVSLPVAVDVEKVEAVLESGVLTVYLPKASSARPRKIEVKALSN